VPHQISDGENFQRLELLGGFGSDNILEAGRQPSEGVGTPG
jgi:hypothetical protein